MGAVSQPGRARAGPAETALAARLLSRSGGREVAFVRAEEGLLWARDADRSPALIELLLGALAGDTWRRQRALRRRIWSTAAAGPFELGAVAVLAKRLGEPVVPDLTCPPAVATEDGPLIQVAGPPLPAPLPIDAGLAERARAASDPVARLRLAAALAVALAADAPRWARDRPLCALLFGPAGELLGWARNRVGQHRAWHAELLVLLDWARAHPGHRLPPGSELVVALEPCAMCAGLLWTLAAEPARLRVRCARPETGPAARGSILRPESVARARFADDAAARAATPISLHGD